MASKDKITFRSLEELKDPSLTEKIASNEFAEELPIDEFLGDEKAMFSTKTTRRNFLKFLGFGTAAATLAACEAPVVKSVPYIVKPEGIVPGVPDYYASTLFNGFDLASVLVKTREGRPIKVDSNKNAKLFSGSTARSQASVLSLYDNNRAKGPKLNNQNTDWKSLDAFVSKGLQSTLTSGKKVVILTPSFPSPSTKKIIADFKTVYPTTEHIVYDSVSYSSALDASQEVYGSRILPLYDLSKAELLVSFGADFLNDWNGGHLEESYSKAKVPGKNMLKHIQIESNLSLSGANADERMPLKPSAVQKLLAEVYKALDGNSANKVAVKIAKELKEKGPKAVVFADGDKSSYVLAYLINQKIGSQVADSQRVVLMKESDDSKFSELIHWLDAGNVEVLLNFNTNPVHSYSEGDKLATLLKKVPYSVSLSEYENETALVSKALAPVPHWLESWGDINPATGVYLLVQPTIQRIFDTRQFQDSLLVWKRNKNKVNTNSNEEEANNADESSISPSIETTEFNSTYTNSTATPPQTDSYYNFLKEFWKSQLASTVGYSFNQALYNGYNESKEVAVLTVVGGDSAKALNSIQSIKEGDLELNLYLKTSIGDGTQANNPWLQELPDPISRLTWDNYITISEEDASKLKLRNEVNGRMQLDGSLVDVTVNGKTIKDVPVFIQPGQAKGSIGLALGYGQKTGKVGKTGVNAYPAYNNSNFNQYNISLKDTGKMHEFASMQMQGTLMGRYEIAREIPLETYLNEKSEVWNPALKMGTYVGEMPIGKIGLWTEFDSKDGPHFNLSVDLNSCTGCGACIIACQAENNVPVVGKEEVRMSRDMFWLRIDRYYSAKKKIDQREEILENLDQVPMYKELIKPDATNPDVIFQPVMCQHCNHAPCETVCPVAATSHGKQGQNQMAYNRCVGTRYCANNCPYKVRRFNWFNYALNDKFDYNMNNDVERMVLNPDVVVRSRGVMEKCSLCIQMTQATILNAKKEGRRVKDGEFQVACSQACSTGAIQFGDVNDPESEILKLSNDKRKYVLLEDIGTKPNVFYQYKVRNRTK
ncbi:4Fe-4S dicluster domain-containing protein [Apibacter muscae]|uniref:TAT-variant-translocated molybdopterin oxidoreductase n=1 Tax=Apibacter muscae TaxID=2509004 RepID=UPI0011AC88C2|nr:TAT-variant-translocated molybdopterin oxidoreductase [Apibacter muscae]TWP31546.1 4Fe-4S dicluster domain-containing protein [Apibacter muscae]